MLDISMALEDIDDAEQGRANDMGNSKSLCDNRPKHEPSNCKKCSTKVIGEKKITMKEEKT